MAEGAAERMLVVLGCRPGRGGALEGAAKRRVEAAAGVYRAMPARTVVVCTGGRAWDGVVEADAFARGLEERGVPAAAIVRERCSMTTVDNARFAHAVFARRRSSGHLPTEVIVVTCEWHLPRATRHFRAAGLSVVGVPAALPPSRIPRPLRDRYYALRERAAALLDELAR